MRCTMSKVFISYSTKDLKDAQLVLQELEKNGIPCWIAPRDIPGGSDYTSMIPAAIKNCQVMVLILSQNAEQSNWVPLELTRAINSKKTIIPFVVEKYDVGEQFDFQLAICQKYEAYENKQAVLKQLVDRVRSLVGAQQIPTAPEENWSQTPGPLTGFNGLYQHVDVDNHRDFLRFFPDGRILYARTICKAQAAAQWMGPNHSDVAMGRFLKNSFEADITPKNGEKVTIRGHFENPTKLILETLHVGKNQRNKVTFGWCALTFPQNYTSSPSLADPGRRVSNIRFDGLYQYLADHGIRHFLRFFPDGQVAYLCTTYPAANAAQWMGPNASARAKASYLDNYFDAVIPLKHGKKVKLSGNVLDSTKILATIQNTETTDSFANVSFGFVNLKFPQTFLAPPAKLLHIAQYDGVYQRKGKKGRWDLVRFLPDDTILYAQTDQTAEEAAKWFGGEYPVRAKNTMTGRFVQALFKLPDGKKVSFEGTVSRGKLRVKVTDRETKESETVDFQFARIAYPETYQESPIQIESGLRYDGIYYEKDVIGLSRFYRFFPDNVVVCAKAVGTPEQVATWLNMQYSKKANYTRKNNVIEFTVKDDGKRKLHHMGTLMTSPWGIKMEIHASVNDSVFTKQLDFCPDQKTQE